MTCVIVLVLSLLVACDGSGVLKHSKYIGFKRPLSDGNSIPAAGLGTFLGFDESGQKIAKEHEVENAVKWALDAGYRLIDTAAAYRNEDQVGAGVRASGVPREDIFIVTKLAANEQRDVLGSLRNSLTRLNMSYVDLYLIHSPVTYKPDFSAIDIIDYVDTWKSMEEAKKQGLAKSIGVSNFNASMIQRLLKNCEIKPTVLQVEVNINLAQNELIDFCKSNRIVVMGYTPFGSLFMDPKPPITKSDDPILVEIAGKHGKSVAQVALRYLIQKGVVPIPKSVNKKRIEENINLFDFELSSEEMEKIGKLNQNYRTIFPTFWQAHPYYPYEIVETTEPSPFKGQGAQI